MHFLARYNRVWRDQLKPTQKMKTFKLACQRARIYQVADPYLYVTAVLMSKIIMDRDEPLHKNRRDTINTHSFRISDVSRFQSN